MLSPLSRDPECVRPLFLRRRQVASIFQFSLPRRLLRAGLLVRVVAAAMQKRHGLFKITVVLPGPDGIRAVTLNPRARNRKFGFAVKSTLALAPER